MLLSKCFQNEDMAKAKCASSVFLVYFLGRFQRGTINNNNNNNNNLNFAISCLQFIIDYIVTIRKIRLLTAWKNHRGQRSQADS